MGSNPYFFYLVWMERYNQEYYIDGIFNKDMNYSLLLKLPFESNLLNLDGGDL